MSNNSLRDLCATPWRTLRLEFPYDIAIEFNYKVGSF